MRPPPAEEAPAPAPERGVLAPRAWSEAGGGDDVWWRETQCLLEPVAGLALVSPLLEGQLRFLHAAGTQVIDFAIDAGPDARGEEQAVSFLLAAVPSGDGCSPPIAGLVRAIVEEVPARRPLLRLRVRVENLTAWAQPGTPREEALRGAMIDAQVVVGRRGGAFALVSPLHPTPVPAPLAQAPPTSHLVGDAQEG